MHFSKFENNSRIKFKNPASGYSYFLGEPSMVYNSTHVLLNKLYHQQVNYLTRLIAGLKKNIEWQFQSLAN